MTGTTPSPPIAVEISGLRRRLRADGGAGAGITLALESWSIPSGAAVALTGPSGCGKTTQLHLIAGFMRPDAGSVQLEGQPWSILAPAERDRLRPRRMGMVFQNRNLLGALSVRDNLALGLGFGRYPDRRAARSRIDALLDRVDLRQRASEPADRLSTGEQQRVAVLRALAHEPRMVIADEPTASLDPVSATAVRELLVEECRREGVTLIVATHDPALTALLPERFDAGGLLTRGRVGESTVANGLGGAPSTAERSLIGGRPA